MPVLFLLPLQTVHGQSEKLEWKLSGRMHFDGVSYLSAPDTLSHELDIVDLRIGGKVTFGNWYMKVDIGYASNKVAVKDAFIQYAKNSHYFRAGHQCVFTGMEHPNGSNDMLFNSISNIASLLYSGRRLGLTYTCAMPRYYLSAGAFVGNDINVRSIEKQGYTVSMRGVWRPIKKEYQLFHIGASALYKVPDEFKGSGNKSIVFSNRGVVRVKSPELHFLNINNAKKQVELVAEVYAFSHKWMMQGEYFWTRVNRVQSTAYRAHGGYIQAGYLLRGEHYGYDSVDAFSTLPTDRGSLLLVARYNNSRMNDHSAGLSAGNQQDFSLGLDYMFNKYISTRLGYSYVKLDEHSTVGEDDLHVVQARLQFKF